MGAARSRSWVTIARLDFERFRAEFPVLASRAYLNAGTDGPLPARAVEAARARFEHELREGRSGRVHWDGLDALCETTRSRLAALMGASPDEVALTRSATDAINLVLAGLRLGPGRRGADHATRSTRACWRRWPRSGAGPVSRSASRRSTRSPRRSATAPG